MKLVNFLRLVFALFRLGFLVLFLSFGVLFAHRRAARAFRRALSQAGIPRPVVNELCRAYAEGLNPWPIFHKTFTGPTPQAHKSWGE